MDEEHKLRRELARLMLRWSAHEIVDALIGLDVANVPSIEASLQGFYAATDEVGEDGDE